MTWLCIETLSPSTPQNPKANHPTTTINNNKNPKWPSHTFLWHMLKELSILFYRCSLLSHVYCCSIYNSLETETAWPATDKWILKVGYVYTMEYHSAVKRDEVIKLSGKWVELEKTIIKWGKSDPERQMSHVLIYWRLLVLIPPWNFSLQQIHFNDPLTTETMTQTRNNRNAELWNTVPRDTSTRQLPRLGVREHCRKGSRKTVRARGSGSLLSDCVS